MEGGLAEPYLRLRFPPSLPPCLSDEVLQASNRKFCQLMLTLPLCNFMSLVHIYLAL